MAGLHCAGGGLLAHSGGSGCATAWHRHLLQPKAGAIPLVAGLDSRRWWRDGSVLSTEHESTREQSATSLRCARFALRQSCAGRCALHGSHGSRDVGEFWAMAHGLCCCQARGSPGQGLWRGEGICSVFRMNPVLADHLRAHSAEVRGGRVCRG